MSVLLTCQSISKSFLGKPLFQDFQFSIYENDKVGLIGKNGSGKSTLLRILVEQEDLDSGSLMKKSGLTIAYVSQLEDFDEERSVYDTLYQAAEQANVPDVEAAVNITLGKCGFPDGEMPVAKLSGGWKKRLNLACGFVKQAELLLLDEPTNHLDLEGVIWLEEYLKGISCSWLAVSHDRIFLETSTNKIAEIDKVYPQGVYVSDGSLGDFLRAKSAYVESEQQRQSSLENKVRREKEWLARGPKARGTKAKGRIDSAYALMEELSEVKARMRQSESEIDFLGTNRKTKRLFEATNVSMTLGEKELFKEVSFVLSPKHKIGILGPNGSGKSTLLKIIAGELEATSGTLKRAKNLQVVYFDQHRDQIDGQNTIKEVLAPDSDSVVFQEREIHVISWLSRFQFRAEQLHTQVKDLSGGEQARLLVARLMLQPADILLLDEPTNDLDIETLETLEESLNEFPGAIMLVSHDRYLMGRVCNGFMGLDGKGQMSPYASFEQWWQDFKSSKASQKKGEKKSEKGTTAATITYEERKEYSRLEKSIEKQEKQIATLQQEAESPEIATDAEKLATAYEKIEEAKAKLDELYERWAELDEKF